jgi:DNA-binding beta-propeller fold protein YncE
VVNNSNKIEVVDMVSFKNIGTIKNLTSPRYLVAIDSSTGYVSDLYSNKITIVNLSSFEIIGYIDCWGSTEEMLKIDDKVYITNTKTEYIYIANSLTNQIIDSLKLSLGSNSIVKDKENHIWVSCVGDNSKKIPAALYKINTNHLKVDLKFTFEQGGNYWSRVKTNLAGDSIFYIKQHLYAFSIKDPSFPKEPFINNNGRNIYGFGINPLNGEIYLADALDFSQRGIVYRYAQRKELSKFNASIIPSDFIFYPLNFNQKK